MKSILFIIMVIFLSSCASSISHAPVLVHDVEFCTDLGSRGAICTTTLSHSRREISAQAWGMQRIGMICTDSEGFAQTFATQEQLCTQLEVCDYETQQKIIGLNNEMKMLARRGKRIQEEYGIRK
jgi:hypothetical protein